MRAGTEALPQMRTVTARMSLRPGEENCQPTSRQGWPQLGAVGRQGQGKGRWQGWGSYNVSHDRRTGINTHLNVDIIIILSGNGL